MPDGLRSARRTGGARWQRSGRAGTARGHYPPIALVTRHGISSSRCQDHHPAAIAPRPLPSDPQPIGRGAKLLSRLRRRSRRSLSDTAGLPIGAVDRNGGLTRCRRWRTCWTGFRSGGTTCPPASQTARRRKHWMPCWSCAVMSKNFRRSSCQRASDGTDGAQPWRYRQVPARKIALATSGAVHIRLLVAVYHKSQGATIRRLRAQRPGNARWAARALALPSLSYAVFDAARQQRPRACGPRAERDRHSESDWAYRSGREPPSLTRQRLRQWGFCAIPKMTEKVWSGAVWSGRRDSNSRPQPCTMPW